MGSGGIGAFAQGFTNSFQSSMKQRKLREQLDIENSMKIQREKRLNEQFQTQQGLREKQFEALERYRGGQQELQQKQLELQERNSDLQTMGAWEKILDPTKPKALRRMMLKQLAGALGVDPKSQQFKDFDTMVAGMEGEPLQDIRQSLLAMFPDAPPGQINAISKSIMTGDLQMKDALEMFTKTAREKRMGEKLKVGPTGGESEEAPATEKGGEQVSTQEPTTEESAHVFTAEQLRNKAVELAQDPDFKDDTAQLQVFLTAARDLEAAGKDKLELKQIVDVDADGNRTQRWVREEEAEGMEAPSGRPVPTAEESRASREAEALSDRDKERLKPIDEKAETARAMMPQIETYRQLLRTGKFQTGSFAGLRESIGQIGRLVGVGQKELDVLAALKVGDPAIAESMDAISKQMGLTFASDVSRLTNMSLELITGALTSLLKSPEGNEIILEVYESKGKMAIEVQDLADQYQDQYGTLRPKGKPSFFEERNKILRRGLLKPDFEERFLKAKAAGEGIDLMKLITGSKKDSIKMIEADGDEVGYEVTGKHEKGLPLVKLRDGNDYPYAATPKDALPLEPGTLYLRQDPIKGPVLWER